MPTSEPDDVVNYVGECGTEGYLCGLCEGDCGGDSTCEGDLVCKSRSAYEEVEGCSGHGGARDMKGSDICVMMDPTSSPTPSPSAPPIAANTVTKVGNPCTSYFEGGLCEVCTGDCDRDADCALGLRCAQRGAGDIVPGCTFAEGSDDQAGSSDYCK